MVIETKISKAFAPRAKYENFSFFFLNEPQRVLKKRSLDTVTFKNSRNIV